MIGENEERGNAFMIQDIAPHRLDRTYVIGKPDSADIALCVRRGRVLLQRQGTDWALPRFGSGIPMEDALHVFSLDGVDCYLARTPEEVPEGMEYVDVTGIRTVRPMEVAFAAITAVQLHRWYGARQFCGHCGHKMAPSEMERAMVCPACGQTEYPKICPAVIVAVTNGDKLLLTRYANRPFRGYALIAGFVEIGETLEDTVHREVMEEVGVRVKNLRYYKNQPWAFTDTLLTGFYCELDGDPDITLDHNELCEGVWLSREEIPSRENDVSLTAEMIDRFRLGKE